MTRAFGRSLLFASALISIHVSACASILGAKEGIADTSEGGASSDATPEGPVTENGFDATPDTAGDSAMAQADCGAGPDLGGAAVFVAPTGSDGAACGPITSPCRTIQGGLDRAHSSGVAVVHVARGTYSGSLRLYGDIALDGGWDVLNDTWMRACDGRSAVTVAGDTASAIVADSLSSPASISSMTITTKSQAAPGESLYGVLARGATTRVMLHDVSITASDGGAGTTGAQGSNGNVGLTGCAPGDGNSGGNDGAPGAAAGTGAFTQSGYVPSVATDGRDGAPGHNGSAPKAPTCANCVTCSGTITCTTGSAPASCGTAGASGCGGGAGRAGNAGGSGGSSVALFAWDATIAIDSSSLSVGKGGDGGPGGAGGAGANGSPGAAGSAGATCSSACAVISATCSASSTAAGVAGGLGGAGGAGSRGGAGGGGAGGWSIAIVAGGSAVVQVETTSVAHGQAGAGAGNGAWGKAGDRWP